MGQGRSHGLLPGLCAEIGRLPGPSKNKSGHEFARTARMNPGSENQWHPRIQSKARALRWLADS